MKNILITGANGMQGTAVITELQRKGYDISVFTTNKDKVVAKNVKIYEGDFSNVASLQNAMEHVDGIYFVLPLNFDEQLMSLYTANFIKAAKNTAPKMIVFNSSILVPKAPTGIAAFDIKLKADKMLEASGLPVVYLRPRIYIDNIAAPWSVSAITSQNIFPYPVAADHAVSWVSLSDMARYTVAAFENTNLIGQKIELGNTPIKGIDLSKIVSEELRQTITYIPIEPDDFQNQLEPVFGLGPAKSVADIYRYLNDNPSEFQVTDQGNKLLNTAAIQHADWIKSIPWTTLA